VQAADENDHMIFRQGAAQSTELLNTQADGEIHPTWAFDPEPTSRGKVKMRKIPHLNRQASGLKLG